MRSLRRVAVGLLAVSAIGCGSGGGSSGAGPRPGAPGATFTVSVRGDFASRSSPTADPVFLVTGGKVESGQVSADVFVPDGRIDCGLVGGTRTTACSADYAWGTTGLVLRATLDVAKGITYSGFAGDCEGEGRCALGGNADKMVLVRFLAQRTGHPNWSDAALHGPQYEAFATQAPGALPCTSCHGASLQGQGLAVSCSACHAWPLATATPLASRYAVGGFVSGLVGSGLVLRNGGGDDLAVLGPGSFAFATALATGATYSVTVAQQPTSPAQTCTVYGGTGTVATSAVASVWVSCATQTTGGTTSPSATHPALVSAATLAALVAKANAGDPAWLALQAECAALDGGTVSPPSGPVTDLPNLPTSNDYQGLDYLRFGVDTALCYQVERARGNAASADRYGAKLVAIAMSLTDPAHQYGHNAPASALQLEDDGWSMRTYPMALLHAYDLGYELFTPAQRAAIANALDSFIDTYDRGWAYPVITDGRVTGAVLWYGPSGSGTDCAVDANGGGGSGATCAVTRTNGRVTAIEITTPGSGYVGTGSHTPYFRIGGVSTIPYGGGGAPFSSGTFDSNYYAPYYAVKALTALLTADSNPRATEYWSDWVTRVHGGIVQPWYAAYRAGGGWHEGFQNYGERAVQLMSLPATVIADVTGTDLVNDAAAPYRFPLDSIDYMFYATWPSLDFVFDEGLGYAATNPPSGYAQGSYFRYLYGFGKRWSHPRLAQFHQFVKDVLAVRSTSESAADDFVYWSASDPDASYASLPLSYLAQGPTQGAGHVFARSDWTRDAVWLGFEGGVYLNNSGQGEEKYGKGGLEVVRGGKPLIVLEQWLNHHASGENTIYQHDYADPRVRDLYNTFQVFHLGAAEDTNQMAVLPPRVGLTADYGSGYLPAGARTRVSVFDDGGSYLLATSRYLEDEYRPWAGGASGACPVASWTRSLLFLRATSQIVVYDRTATCAWSTANAVDQQLVFMTPAAPVLTAQSPAVSGTTRYDVTYGGTFMGSVISVLPAAAAPSFTDIGNLSTAWRIAFRPPGCSAAGCSPDPGPSLRWLTVLDVNASPGAVANASSLTATGMTGVLLQQAGGNAVALFNAGAAGTTVSGAIGYAIPAGVATRHVLSELPASVRYAVTTAAGAVTVTPDAGGAFTSSSRGVLTFTTDAAGNPG
jgi:hypothetical protein